MDTSSVGRILVVGGVIALAVGCLLLAAGAAGIGRLPGDFRFGRGNLRVYVPLATCILVSIVATVVLNLLSRR